VRLKVVFLVVLFALSGCGVRPTGVLTAGRPAVGAARGPVLYFLSREGILRPTQREIGQLGTITNALQLLVAGPTEAERASGLVTAVPKLLVEAVSAEEPVGSVITIHLPTVPLTLPPVAVQQLVCTAVGAAAMAGADGKGVLARLPGMGPQHCPALR
jgi:hypothetical protein